MDAHVAIGVLLLPVGLVILQRVAKRCAINGRHFQLQ